MRISKLLLLESVTVLGIVAIITHSLILSSNTMHFQRLFINYYADKSVDFSADATTLVRSLGIVNLLTLLFGLTIGAAMALTVKNDFDKTVKAQRLPRLDEYEMAVVSSGLVKITGTQKGKTYQLTELGRRFLADYEFLRHRVEETAVARERG